MVRIRWLLMIAIGASVCSLYASAAWAQCSHRDFSKLDPSWAVKELDRSFQTGDGRVAWASLKAGFPADYEVMLGHAARALMNCQDWAPITESFISEHTKGQVKYASQAPASYLVRFQRSKADLMVYLSTSDVRACVAIADGDQPAVNDHIAKQKLSEVLAAFVDAAVAGHRDPQGPRSRGSADVATLKAEIVKGGTDAKEADQMFRSQVGVDLTVRCRRAVILNKTLADAPEDLVAKFAIIGP